jgi:hypothetical protein
MLKKVVVEISVGEALDKLSILEIKKDKIKDEEKLKHVSKEHTYLSSQLEEGMLKNYAFYYSILKKVNEEIWDLQDRIRSEKMESGEHNKLTDEILDLNDSRFLVKNKLNLICNSNFLEQKGYGQRRLTFDLRGTEFAHALILNAAVRYYSTFYDVVNLIIDEENLDKIRSVYSDDSSIVCSHKLVGDVIFDYICPAKPEGNVLNHSYFASKTVSSEGNENIIEFVKELYTNCRLSITDCVPYFYSNDGSVLKI